ncbi:MAG: BON domain-containing protein [Acidobacteria bacterium]|nr:BON domain-containing protein [Acidobacteriota bacterium]
MIRTYLRSISLATVLLTPVAISAAGCGKSVGNVIDDATITGRVKTALLNDPDVAGLKIDVDTFKGVVTLSGAVKSREEADKAQAIARRTPGVTDVKSTLQINP